MVPTSVKFTDSAGIIRLASNSSGRNRSVVLETFVANLDPNGTHVLAHSMVHNDCEVRTRWLGKFEGTMEPCGVWLDVDFDVLESVIFDTKDEDDTNGIEYN